MSKCPDLPRNHSAFPALIVSIVETGRAIVSYGSEDLGIPDSVSIVVWITPG